MLTGYEQVRSVVAAIAGDMAAADDVHLVLPETGVCSTGIAADAQASFGCCGAPAPAQVSSGCCGGPAPANADACCVADAEAKTEGRSSCGCGSNAAPARSTLEKFAERADWC
jgi:hypothetical protein